MTTLAEMTRLVAQGCTVVQEGTATGGDTTYLEDSQLVAQTQKLDGGTLWMLSGLNAGLAAIIKNSAPKKIIIYDTLDDALAEGDRYAVANADFPFEQLIQFINDAMGKQLGIDETTTTVSGQTVYDLPTGVSDIDGVEIVNNLGETNEDMGINTHWKERAGQILFDKGFEPDGSAIMRLLYRKTYDRLSAFDDVVDPALNVEWLMWDAIVLALQWGYRKYTKDPTRNVPEFLNAALKRQAEFKGKKNRELATIHVRTSGW
jgi:hypothetical protein